MDSPEYLTDSDSLKNKLNFFFELIGCSYNLAYWKYGEDGHMIISTSEDSRILDTLFSVGNIKAFMLNYGKNNDMPLIISSPLGNIWVIIVEHLPQFNNYHVMGPLFTNSISKSAIKERLEAFQIPISWKKDFEKLILSFPSIPWNQVIHYTIMFHYIVTGEKISSSDFVYHGEQGSTTSSAAKTPQVKKEDKTSLPWNAEQALLNNIREGNSNYKEALSLAASYSSGVKVNTGNPLRQAKDSGIVFCSLCARAAIDGGLSAESSYTIQNMYTQSIEDASTISDIANINHEMYADYIARVQKIKLLPNTSQQIRKCMEYISEHIEEDIDLSILATKIGYSEYYLSRKFKSEVGTNINQFIRSEKLKIAKILLLTTDKSVQEISDNLSFCSRSYFTDVFNKEFGMAPSEYRQKNKN